MTHLIKSNQWFWVFGILSIVLIIVSFLLPPTGKIDPSVLQAVGELFGFASLATVIYSIDKSSEIKIRHNNTEATLIKNGLDGTNTIYANDQG